MAHLTTRVREPNKNDWMKLVKTIRYLDQKDCLAW